MIKSALDEDIAAHFAAARLRAADMLERAAQLVRQGSVPEAADLDRRAWHELRLERLSAIASHPSPSQDKTR